MKNTLEIYFFFQISTYILNGREITKIVLAKQKSCLNETKIINNK